MSMFSEVYDLLAKFKGKSIQFNDYQLIKSAALKQARPSINVWRFKPEIKILFKMAKYQSYLMLFLGITVLPFTLYKKYEQDKQKLTRILIFAPFALAACVGPYILYKRFSKKLIQSISFNLQNKKLVLTRFRDGKQIFSNLKDVSYTKSDKGRVKQLIWKKNIEGASNLSFIETRKYQIQGLGEWESVQLLKYLVENGQKQSL